MNRRQLIATSSFALIGTALKKLPVAAFQAPAAAPPPLTPKFEDLRRSVGAFSGRGGTIGYLATRDGIVVIDSQFPDAAQACIDGLKQKSTHAIDLLINTHHHGDHTAGNMTFRPLVKNIVAHANSAMWQKKVAEQAKTEAAQAYPDQTFVDTWKTTIGDETISARYYGAGHTLGDAVVTFEKANVVHMGDLMFVEVHPRIDRPAGGSITNWIKTLEAVPGQHAADTIYIFGHGKRVTGTRAELAGFRNYFTEVLDYTRTQMQAGKSKEEIVKTAALPKFETYESLTRTINLAGVLEVAYDELSGSGVRS
jgi:glyoxylase-like metal-dependent hydrolase (beta-lactamase superfamily II)